jgi:hypothetical protein
MNDLIDQLEQLVDSGSERVKAMFAELRAAVPRTMTLVFVKGADGVMFTSRYQFSCWKSRVFEDMWIGCDKGAVVFNAAWSAMTETGVRK